MTSRLFTSYVTAMALLILAPAPAIAQVPLDPERLARHGLIKASDYDAAKPPIVIVHGDNSSRANPEIFDPLIEDLSRDFNVFIYTYQRNMIRPRDPINVKQAVGGFVEGITSIEDASNKFDDAIRELIRQTSARNLTVMGYSLGGIVGRDPFTTDRATDNTLASDRLDAVKYNVVLVAVPQQGIQSLNILDVPILGTIVRGAGAAATRFSPFWGPLGDGSHPLMRGAPGANVRLCQIVTDESEAGDDYVVTVEGQQPVDPSAATPADNVHRIKAGHVQVLTEFWPEIAKVLREKAGLPPRRTRRVAMIDGTGAGGELYYVSAPDMRLVRAQDVVTPIVNGNPGQSTTTTRDPAELNAAYLYHFDVETIALNGAATIASWQGGAFRLSADGSFGRADATLTVRASSDDASTGPATTFASNGFAWRVGLRGQWSAAPESDGGMFVTAGYRYERIGDLDLRRDPPLTAPGAVVEETDRLGFRAHVIEGQAGYRRGAFAASAGVRHASRATELSGAVTADFSASAGFPAAQTLLFVNCFEERTTGIVGRAALRVGPSPVTVHVDASRGGGWTALAVGATIGIVAR